MPHAAHVASPAASPGRSPPFWVPTLYLAQGLPFYAVALVAGVILGRK